MTQVLRSPDAEMFGQLHNAVNDAFSDYVVPTQLSFEQFSTMIRQRSLELQASSVAIINAEVAAFWLIGLRGTKSYLISSGTRPKHRRQGLSTRIGRHSFELLRSRGVKDISAEVISTNEAAIALYDDLGFETQRKLQCYKVPAHRGNGRCHHAVETSQWADVRSAADRLLSFRPSWQNDLASLDALGADTICLSVKIDGRVVGYLTLLSTTICQLAVDPDHRRRGIASDLLRAASRQTGTDLHFLNIDADDTGMRKFLSRHDAEETIAQFEIARLL